MSVSSDLEEYERAYQQGRAAGIAAGEAEVECPFGPDQPSLAEAWRSGLAIGRIESEMPW